MAISIKKVTASSTKLVVAFDTPPSAQDFIDFLKKIDPLDRPNVKIQKVSNINGDGTQSPVRFIFSLDSQTEVDVPVV